MNWVKFGNLRGTIKAETKWIFFGISYRWKYRFKFWINSFISFLKSTPNLRCPTERASFQIVPWIFFISWMNLLKKSNVPQFGHYVCYILSFRIWNIFIFFTKTTEKPFIFKFILSTSRKNKLIFWIRLVEIYLHF